MLWRVADFKGIRTAQLDVGRGQMTVLTGINSSGKSSVIQSLLLLAQSVYNDTPIVLNGPLVRLGGAQDLVREQSTGGGIELTVGLDADSLEDANEIGTLEAKLTMVPAEDESTLRVRRFEIEGPESNRAPLVVDLENARASDVALAKSAVGKEGSSEALHLKSLLGDDRRQLRTYVVVQGFRPLAVVQLMKPLDLADRYRAAIMHALDDLVRDDERAISKELQFTRMGNWWHLREFINLLNTGMGSESNASLRPAVASLQSARFGNLFDFVAAWSSFDLGLRETLIEIAVERRAARPFAVVPIRDMSRGVQTRQNLGLLESGLAERLGSSYDALRALRSTVEQVGNRVQYLGPLRDEPRVVWNHWNELARGLPVGTRGEYSAAVLSRSSGVQINYVTPSDEPFTATLADAVNEWLTFLQIGEQVDARAQGKLGVGLDLQMGGSIRDLTSVGVGVSQALPLLVGLLSAPADSIFIVEQPELHLHPAVQARLADFMISARPDLAILVETHSESFITRIRRRAAEGALHTRSINITFVESLPSGSVARNLEVSEFGDLNEWPEGFLTGVEDDIQAILRANIAKAAGARDGS